MNLKDIKPEEFTSAFAMMNNEPERFQYLQTEAVAEVPLIEYFMKVYMHDVESKAPKLSVETDKFTLSLLTALYLLKKNAENPGTQD